VITTFWTVSALLCVVAAAILFVPMWLHRRRGGRWSPVGVVASIAIAPLALSLYLYVSDWDPEYAARTSLETDLIEQLVQHLESNPNDLEGWRFLAASYMQLGRYEQGRAAYQRLWALTLEPDDELKVAYAESQILTDRASLTGEAGRLIEEVLVTRPGDPKALWYGGLVALDLGRDDAVRARWTSLLALNPPEEVARVVRGQLATLGGAAAEGALIGTPAVAGPTIKLSLSLGTGRSTAELGPGAQLFILARAPEGGPPVAVIRRPASTVPGEFTLSDADSMIQGRSLANYPEITVVARLSMTGQPTAQSGDWFAEATVRPSDAATVALVIDQVVQ
jgi:cytochrome c-type biogenesis protein CcmH